MKSGAESMKSVSKPPSPCSCTSKEVHCYCDKEIDIQLKKINGVKNPWDVAINQKEKFCSTIAEKDGYCVITGTQGYCMNHL